MSRTAIRPAQLTAVIVSERAQHIEHRATVKLHADDCACQKCERRLERAAARAAKGVDLSKSFPYYAIGGELVPIPAPPFDRGP